jgi:serine/threonine protein kinase
VEPLRADDPRAVGPYRLHARLGLGGMGCVYLGSSPAGRVVAVKLIHPELAHDEAFRDRFRREVAAARQVSGAYTAPVVDAGADDDPPWLVTALVAGPSLADIVTASGPLPPESLWRLAAGLVEALMVVHGHGLVHRDLKPPNVLLAADGPRVIDFGISRALDATTATTTGMIVGTASFMSPEQAEGLPVGPASDVFSLGCVLAYAATGSGPFGAGTPASIIYRVVHTQPALDGITGPLRNLITRCLAKDPAERATLAELMGLITAQPAPPAPALAFWPPGLAETITAYQAQLTSAVASVAPPESGDALTPPPHQPTQLAAAPQHYPGAEPTITAHHPSQIPSPPEIPTGAGRPSRGRPRRVAALAAAAGILTVAGVVAVGVAVGTRGHKPAPAAPSTTKAPAPPATRPTATSTRIVHPVRHRTTPPAASASPAGPGPAVAFGCKVLQTGPGQEEFNVTTTGGATYNGTVAIMFYDYPGSGDTFPPTSVQGATPNASWYPVPAADIGASAEPSGCIASAG